MNAFRGLRIAAGVNKQNMTNVKRLWNIKLSSPLFCTTMTRERFKMIRCFFRSDDKVKRNGNDKLSPVRVIFERKVRDYQTCYSHSPYLSIDEQFLPFHGRLSFRMYSPSKPERYCVRIVLLVDNDTGYIFSGLLYIRQNAFMGKPFQEIASARVRTVMVVCEPIFGKRANSTGDN